MKLRLIRNATLLLSYGGRTILIDPCLGAKGTLPSFAGIAPNPTVDLPMVVEDVLDEVELILISHLHPDHFDATAVAVLPKSVPLLCQAIDLDTIESKGFGTARALTEELDLEGLTIIPTRGQHGTGEMLRRMGPVMGFVLRAEDEPTLYWAGDTILTPEVLKIMREIEPGIVVTHSGGAKLDQTLLIMDDLQTVDLCHHARKTTVIAVHLEALDHCTVTREQLRCLANNENVSSSRLLIPADGEEIWL
jgi:L-ascorbate metabolism protein UlaG (beta-lactamase superfamily)